MTYQVVITIAGEEHSVTCEAQTEREAIKIARIELSNDGIEMPPDAQVIVYEASPR